MCGFTPTVGSNPTATAILTRAFVLLCGSRVSTVQKAVVSFLGQRCEVCIDDVYALDAGH